MDPAMFQVGADRLFFVFPKMALKFKSVISFWLQIWASSLCMFTSHPPKLSLTATIENAGHGVGVFRNELFWTLEVLMGLLWACGGEVFPLARGKLPDRVSDVGTKTCMLLMPSENTICHFPSIFLFPSHAAHDSVLWMVWEINRSPFQHTAQLGKPGAHTFSLSPVREVTLQECFSLPLSCATWENGCCR